MLENFLLKHKTKIPFQNSFSLCQNCRLNATAMNIDHKGKMFSVQGRFLKRSYFYLFPLTLNLFDCIKISLIFASCFSPTWSFLCGTKKLNTQFGHSMPQFQLNNRNFRCCCPRVSVFWRDFSVAFQLIFPIMHIEPMCFVCALIDLINVHEIHKHWQMRKQNNENIWKRQFFQHN